MNELKHHNYHNYNIWLEMALKDDEVWPFLTSGTGKTYAIDLNDDWLQVHYISDAGLSLASLYFERRKEKAQISLHTLSHSGIQAKRHDSREMIYDLLYDGFVFKKHGIKFLDFTVHSTNTKSVSAFSKRFPCWGIEPQGIYDRKLGEWVDAHHFRITKEAVMDHQIHSRLDKYRKQRG